MLWAQSTDQGYIRAEHFHKWSRLSEWRIQHLTTKHYTATMGLLQNTDLRQKSHFKLISVSMSCVYNTTISPCFCCLYKVNLLKVWTLLCLNGLIKNHFSFNTLCWMFCLCWTFCVLCNPVCFLNDVWVTSALDCLWRSQGRNPGKDSILYI